MHFKYTTGTDYISGFQTNVWEPTGFLKLVLSVVPSKRRTCIIKKKNWNNNERLFWRIAIDPSLNIDCLWRFFLQTLKVLETKSSQFGDLWLDVYVFWGFPWHDKVWGSFITCVILFSLLPYWFYLCYSVPQIKAIMWWIKYIPNRKDWQTIEVRPR